MTDQIELRVGAKTQVAALAGSIIQALLMTPLVVLRAIGPVPISQAVKAVATANRIIAKKGGVKLAMIPELVTENIVDTRGNGEETPWVIAVLTLVDAGNLGVKERCRHPNRKPHEACPCLPGCYCRELPGGCDG